MSDDARKDASAGGDTETNPIGRVIVRSPFSGMKCAPSSRPTRLKDGGLYMKQIVAIKVHTILIGQSHVVRSIGTLPIGWHPVIFRPIYLD